MFLLKALEGVLHQWWKLSLTELVFVETFMQTYSLLEGCFGWTVKTLSESRVSWKYLAKMWKISKMRSHLLRRFADGRTDGAYLGGRRCTTPRRWGVEPVTCLAKSQGTQNGTMFVDLDWPLNASRRLSASAELLVHLNIKWIFFHIKFHIASFKMDALH